MPVTHVNNEARCICKPSIPDGEMPTHLWSYMQLWRERGKVGGGRQAERGRERGRQRVGRKGKRERKIKERKEVTEGGKEGER